MDESTIVFVAMSIGFLVGALIAWFVRNELGRRRLLGLEADWTDLHRKTERQRDDFESRLRTSSREVAKAERDLRDHALKTEEALREVHSKKLQIRELEANLKEEQATRQSQKAVIALIKSQKQQSGAVPKASRAKTAPEKHAQGAGIPKDGPDDLKQIRGIGPAYEAKLHELGVTTFAQIARWDSSQVLEFAIQLGVPPRRIERDDWVVGAKYRLMSQKGYEN